ncbi:MAG: trypsin-like peptidase domain-containing protein [Acidimicrobiales bacterium]
MIQAGPDPSRVVQVRVRPLFGSGYLIGRSLVLTAAHVVVDRDGAPSAAVTVQAPGRAPVDGAVVWWRHDERGDAALVRTATAERASPLTEPATRFGSFISAEPNQQVEAIGFPRQQKFGSVRDQEHFVGSLSPQTGAVSGHYELTSATPLPLPAPGQLSSPWAGMSGAAVFSCGLLVGVLRGDRQARSGARLTATTLAELVADEAFRRTVAEMAGWAPLCEPVELSSFVESPHPNRQVRSIASLLRADAATVEFHGRETEVEQLSAWCERPEPLSVMVVTGRGGEGKSRLARQFLKRQRSRGWTTGLVRPAVADDMVSEDRFAPIARASGPLLLVVDYAENHPRLVRALLRYARAAAGPVRVLLLARARGVWAEALDEPDVEVRDLLADARELVLGPLAADRDDWDRSFRRAVLDIARALPSVPDHEAPDWLAAAARVVPSVGELDLRQGSALGIQMTALAQLLQQLMPVAVEPGEPVERTVLRHEEAYWTQSAARHGLRGLDRAIRRCAVAVLPLVIVADRDRAVRLLVALGVRSTDRARTAAGWLRELYPHGDERFLGLVQPDRLAEFLLVEACAAEPDLLTRVVSVAGDLPDPERLVHLDSGTAATFGQMWALREAVRAARSQAQFGTEVGPLLAQIEGTASGPAISNETLAWTVANMRSLPEAGQRQDITRNPDGSQTVTSVLDAASAALEIAGYRRGVHSFVADDLRQQGFVHMLHSMTLTQLDRQEEALEVSARAVECFRSAPGAQADLADELHRQAGLLVGLGRDREAIAPLQEEVGLRAVTRPDQLAPALDSLINVLCQIGQLGAAVPYARREIELVRPQSPAPTEDNARSYVRALGRCAEILADIGDRAEALDHCGRADEFISGLPIGIVDALRGDRALLAGVRARILLDAGDLPGSVAAWLESARAWRRLDEPYLDQDPVARVVSSLNNAAFGYARLGDHTRAVEVIRAAVELALGDEGEPLRRDDPGLYELAHATYIGYLVMAGRPGDALSEAEHLCSRATPSSTLPPSFANSLREASLALAQAGRLTDALRASHLAVATLRTVESVDQDHSILLASTLSDHAANLVETGGAVEGAQIAAEAAAVWRRVCTTKPRLRINLVTALSNQATCLQADGRYSEAGNVFALAADELRALLAERPEHGPMLLHLLAAEASCRRATGDARRRPH